MINRLALVIHWISFLLFVVGISFLLLFVGVSIVERGPILENLISFLLDEPESAILVFPLIFLAAFAWAIKYVLAGSKAIFPWNKDK